MTPEHLAALPAIASIISQIGSWPIGSIIIAIILCPWFVVGYTSWSLNRRAKDQSDQHRAAMEMYKNNVKLVEAYQKIAEEHIDTIRLSTGATTELTTFLRARVPCHERITEKLRSIA